MLPLDAEHAINNPNAVRATAPVPPAQVKRKRLKWLRRICSREVELAIGLSSIGIPKVSAPEPTSEAARLALESRR
jgi:hypothetical protein